jgi:hypothetical protein
MATVNTKAMRAETKDHRAKVLTKKIEDSRKAAPTMFGKSKAKS